MRSKILVLVAAVTLMLGAWLFAAPSVSDADVVVTSVVVAFGGTEFCGNTGGACAGGGTKIWDLTPAGISLTAGQTLVLTQNAICAVVGCAPGGGFNFDTSDFAFPNATVKVNSDAAVTDSKGVLRGVFGHTDPDPVDTANQEATDWDFLNSVAGSYRVDIGYADNIHTDPCEDANATCVPEFPWDPASATPATHFLGGGTAAPVGYPVSVNPNHCAANPSPTCYDAGAILITGLQRPPQVPEPSTLLLLGTGLLGLAAYGRRYLNKNS